MNPWRQVQSALAVAEIEARKIRHDPTEVVFRLGQPILWIAIFAPVLGPFVSVAPYTYAQYISPGILAQVVLSTAVFYGATIVYEKDIGIVTKLLATPSSRYAIVTGKALSAGLKGIFETALIYVLSILLGLNLRMDPLSVLGVVVMVVLFAMAFSGLSMFVGSLIKRRRGVTAASQVIVQPLFFASNALYKVSYMPAWLRVIATANPLTYVIGGLQSLMLTGDLSSLPLDFLTLGAMTVFLLWLAATKIQGLIT
jgi:ABC-2 type transport system permease protein